MSENNDRLQWVDSAKGISIILVVMMYSVFNVGQDTGGTGAFHYLIAFATPFRMPEFFLISGLFLSRVVTRDWLRYADRRVVHYFYFYGLWAVIHLVVKVGIGTGQPVLALTDIAWAVIEPYGVLWFIYMLAVFSLITKLFRTLKIPHSAALILGAGLQMANISSPSYLAEQFCHYFVFFYAGYLFAPMIFKLVGWASEHVWTAVLGLVAWGAIEAALVFSPGYKVLPDHIEMGFAGFPPVHLALAITGAVALCVAGALLGKLRFMDWLRWLGEHSLAVYLAFVLPMSASRAVLSKIPALHDVTLLSGIVIVIAIGFPVTLYALVQWTGIGKFLFERPTWAHVPGAAGSRRQVAASATSAPAE